VHLLVKRNSDVTKTHGTTIQKKIVTASKQAPKFDDIKQL